MPSFQHYARFAQPIDSVWSYYDSPGAFDRIMPEWEHLDPDTIGRLVNGDKTIFTTHIGPLRLRWEAVHHDVVPHHEFSDLMVRGPMAYWDHRHVFEPGPNDTSIVRDEVDWRLPLHVVSRISAPWTVNRRLRKLFRFRTVRTERDLNRISETAESPRMRVLLSGASGLVGSQLRAFLLAAGHDVLTLRRSSADLAIGEAADVADRDTADAVVWNDRTGKVLSGSFEGFDAVVHLAGAGIGDRRWSAARKKEIRDSRVGPTRALCAALARCDAPPEVLVSASAVGCYGNRGAELLTEDSAPGSGYLADLCADWETATQEASEAGIRVVLVRSGIVTTPMGGALAKLLLPARLGLGGPAGGGEQYQSWISLDDEVHAIHHLVMNRSCTGAYNLTAPEPVTQREFAESLGRVLRRPAVVQLPAPVVSLAFGEMGRSLILEGQNVLPDRLEESGFNFSHRNLEACLRDSLGRWDDRVDQ